MRTSVTITSIALALVGSGICLAQAPATAPAGSTGECKDGTFYSGPTKSGACSGHKGVKAWYGPTTVKAKPALSAKPVIAAAPAVVATPAPTATPAPVVARPIAAAPRPAANAYTPPATAVAGGGGMVWANASSKVYHCPNDKWYGKTKDGKYLSEADARAQGFHADHGKACL
jgi:Protein of unknown function (DUF3761)